MLRLALALIVAMKAQFKGLHVCVCVCVCVYVSKKSYFSLIPKGARQMTIRATSQYISQFICFTVTAISLNVYLHISKPVYKINDLPLCWHKEGTKRQFSQSICLLLFNFIIHISYVHENITLGGLHFMANDLELYNNKTQG